MKRFVLVLALSFMASCNSIPSNSSTTVQFSVSGGSYGSYSDAKYYVVLDDKTNQREDAARILKYVTYLLRYRNLPETSIQVDADYLVIVSYVDSKENPHEQSLQLVGVSRRVYEALKEIRPNWVSVSKHFGPAPLEANMLPMHALALRDIVGRNPNAYQSGMAISPSDPILKDLVQSVEGK